MKTLTKEMQSAITPSVALEILRVWEFQPNLAIKIKEAGVE